MIETLDVVIADLGDVDASTFSRSFLKVCSKGGSVLRARVRGSSGRARSSSRTVIDPPLLDLRHDHASASSASRTSARDHPAPRAPWTA